MVSRNQFGALKAHSINAVLKMLSKFDTTLRKVACALSGVVVNAYNIRHHGINKEGWKFNGVSIHVRDHNNAKTGEHIKSLAPANHIVSFYLKNSNVENQLKNQIGI